MDLWMVWIVLAVVFAVGEISSLSFFLAPFATSAVVAGVLDLAGAGPVVSSLAFIFVGVALLAGLRPIARRHLRQPPALRTGTDALIGRTARVTEVIDNHESVGAIRLDGETWTARAYDEDVVIVEGARVQVIEIRGATALVSE